jgi:serine/threonine-protein kinase
MMTSKVKISITRGKLAGKSFSIKKPGFISIGGAKECHITLPDDEMVADRHCLLIIRPDEVRLRDLGSVHGTYVNGRVFGAGAEGLTDESGAPQTQEIRLKNNDRLTIGSTEIVIRILKPNSCKRCGYEMSPEELQQARRAGPGPLCASCRHVLQAARARAARAAGGGGGSEVK